MSRPRLKALEMLAQLLKEMPEQFFDVDVWKSSCGTKFCAAGWAAHVGLVKGFSFRSTAHEIEQLCYKGYRGFEAARAAFGLTSNQAMSLFIPDDAREVGMTPADKADQIMRFVKRQRKGRAKK